MRLGCEEWLTVDNPYKNMAMIKLQEIPVVTWIGVAFVLMMQAFLWFVTKFVTIRVVFSCEFCKVCLHSGPIFYQFCVTESAKRIGNNIQHLQDPV